MPVEIERKFLVAGASWRALASGERLLRQAYFSATGNISVRVRIIDELRATLAIKLPRSGLSRFEFEQEISLREGRTLMELCGGAEIRKTRHTLVHAGSIWEIDDYHGRNRGLSVAEIELAREDQPFVRPPWIGREVTGVERYQNSVLAQRPFQDWPEQSAMLDLDRESA